jgi:hypothetical protein
MKFQIVPVREFGYKTFVRVGFRPAQFVIEVHNREHDAELVAQLEQQTE